MVIELINCPECGNPVTKHWQFSSEDEAKFEINIKCPNCKTILRIGYVKYRSGKYFQEQLTMNGRSEQEEQTSRGIGPNIRNLGG